MKDLLETVKAFYAKANSTEKDMQKVNSVLEKLYLDSHLKWWFPFSFTRSKSFKIAKDLIRLEELVNDNALKPEIRLKSHEAQFEFNKIFKNTKQVEAHHYEMVKRDIIEKFHHHRFAVFIFMLIRGEYNLQRKRWIWGIVLGFILGLIGNFAKDKLFPLVKTEVKTEKQLEIEKPNKNIGH